MKSYTDLDQSKKLAEILPVESADMWWNTEKHYPEFVKTYREHLGEQISPIPVWSLAALIGVLPPYLFEFERGIDLNIYPNLNGKGWHCSYMPNAIENMKNDKFKQITNGDNLIDAAFEMILKLHEQKLL